MGKILQVKDIVKKKQAVKEIHRNQYSFVCITVRWFNARKDPIKITTKKIGYIVIILSNV